MECHEKLLQFKGKTIEEIDSSCCGITFIFSDGTKLELESVCDYEMSVLEAIANDKDCFDL